MAANLKFYIKLSKNGGVRKYGYQLFNMG